MPLESMMVSQEWGSITSRPSNECQPQQVGTDGGARPRVLRRAVSRQGGRNPGEGAWFGGFRSGWSRARSARMNIHAPWRESCIDRSITALSTRVTHTVAMIIAALVLAGTLQICAAGAADDSNTELAKKTQNPVADLISVPLQNNFNFSAGPKDATIYVLNVQPVIPINLTEDGT